MLIFIDDAKYIEGYKIELFFNNGERGVADLEDTIVNDHRKIFEALRDEEFFKKFNLKFNTLGWPNELDLAPEYLYELAVKKKEHSVIMEEFRA